jgi:hypothetical protein
MMSKKELQKINDYFNNDYVPPMLNYNNDGGFKLDWSKLDYNIKEKPMSEFDVYFNNLMSKMTIKEE